jgi:cation diffusion facilitator family transporter
VDTTRDKILSLRWAIVLSGFLALIKGLAGFFCVSAALIASALDSLMDAGISSVNYLSVRKASKPPDEDHTYGHGKIESLASYTQGIIFLFFALLILGDAFRRVYHGSAVIHSKIALLIIAFAAIINLTITLILHRTEKKTGSLILKTEKIHYSMDIFSYLMIFLVLVFVQWTGWSGWDIMGGVVLAIYIAFLASQILLQAGNELVDRSLPKPSLDVLDLMIKKHDSRVLGYHELRTRKVGDKSFIDFHLVLKSNQSLEDAHQIAESLIEKIKEKFRNADVTIHEDPEQGP